MEPDDPVQTCGESASRLQPSTPVHGRMPEMRLRLWCQLMVILAAWIVPVKKAVVPLSPPAPKRIGTLPTGP
jgi:hypothetical protein